jgi:hypothetical protein
MWVAIQYTPIEIEPVFKDGDIVSLHTYTRELSDEIARDDSRLGCWNCGDPLTVESYGSECLAEAHPPHNFEQYRQEP